MRVEERVARELRLLRETESEEEFREALQRLLCEWIPQWISSLVSRLTSGAYSVEPDSSLAFLDKGSIVEYEVVIADGVVFFDRLLEFDRELRRLHLGVESVCAGPEGSLRVLVRGKPVDPLPWWLESLGIPKEKVDRFVP